MSNYTKTVDFAAKDSLSSGDGGKVIKGTEFETEFDNIVTAVATKADLASPTFTGTATFATLSDGTIAVVAFADEDDMSSNSATLVPTQQSVKAYVDSQSGDMQFVLEDGDGTEVQITKDKEVKFVEGGGVDINWTDTDNGTDGDPYDLTFTINAAQTGITSVYATDLILGEDSQTAIDFGTANEIDFKADNAARLTLTASAFYPVTNNQIDLGTSSLEFKDAFFDGIVTADAFAGPLTGAVTGNADTATTATNVTASANNSTNETVYPTFVDGATGGQGIETDTGLTYNPSSGLLTAAAFSGPLTGNVTGNVSGTAATVTGAAQSNITSVGTLTALVVDDVSINGATIGHTGDTDLMTVASGVLTVAGEVSMTTLDIGGTNVTATAAELNKLASAGTLKQAGLETIYVPAAAMYPNTTAGCAGLAQVELTNGPELKCLDFDTSSDENAQFTVAFPKSWNEGTVTFQAFWTVTGTNTGTVAWGLSGGSIADDASINTAFGTNVVATAKAFSGTSNDMTVSATSGAVTIANAAVDTMTYFQIMRDVSADDQSGDARLLGIKLFFTTDAANDA
jgi:hypothetical protein